MTTMSGRAVDDATKENNITVYDAYYTDLQGNLIDTAGVSGVDVGSAAKVGGGTLPDGRLGCQG